MMQSRATLESKVGLKEGTERTPGQEESKVEDMDSHEQSGKGELSKQPSEAKLTLVDEPSTKLDLLEQEAMEDVRAGIEMMRAHTSTSKFALVHHCLSADWCMQSTGVTHLRLEVLCGLGIGGIHPVKEGSCASEGY